MISLVIPLEGGPDQALRCFQALAASASEPEHEVIVVDDASVGLDGLLGRLDGNVTVVRSPRRVGFAAACGLGLAKAQGDAIAFLRGAPEVGAGWLAPLAAALADPAVAAAVPVTAGREREPSVAGCALLARREDLRAIGGIPDAPAGLELAALQVALPGSVRQVPGSVVIAPGERGGSARRAPGEDVELSIVIPTLDAASGRVRGCVAAVQAATDVPHELILIDNGAPPQGFTAPVNAGLRAARGRYAVVMNDDVEPLAGWWAPLREALDAGAAAAFPLTIDGVMREDFAAWCFAISRETLEDHACADGEFFDPGLRVWYQDTDLLVRLRAAGTPPVLVSASRIRHGLSQTVGTADPELARWIAEQVQADERNFLAKHPAAAELAILQR